MAENTLSTQISDYLENIRKKTISAFSGVLNECYFFSQKKNTPHIEIFYFSGMPSQKEQLEAWIKKNNRWWNAFKFHYLSYNVFIDESKIFNLRSSRTNGSDYPYRLIFYKNENFDESESETYNKIKGLFEIGIIDNLNELLPLLALKEILHNTENNVGKLKVDIQKLQESFHIPLFKMKRLFHLNSKVLKLSVFVERITMEYNQSKKWMCRGLNNLTNFKDEEKNIKTVLSEWFEFYLPILNSHIEFENESFSRHVELINSNAIYWLTCAVLLLTFAGIIDISKIWDYFLLILKFWFSF